MSDLSKKTLISSGDTKNYIENYWTKRADAFAALRRQELHSEKYSQWNERQHRMVLFFCVVTVSTNLLL